MNTFSAFQQVTGEKDNQFMLCAQCSSLVFDISVMSNISPSRGPVAARVYKEILYN